MSSPSRQLPQRRPSLRGWRVFSAGRGDGPPDLDELWRDLNRRLGTLLGGRGSAGSPGDAPPEPPARRGAGLGLGLVALIAALLWLGSGVFIVQEGSQAVVTTFGKFTETVGAGVHARLPWPFQSHQVVDTSSLQSVDVGGNEIIPATGLRDASMLTQDENIVDIRYTVQYRRTDPRAYLFENTNPDQAVVQAAESAVREIVGRSTMDSVLYEQRDAIAAELAKAIQAQLDRLHAGITIANVNMQSVQPPDQVQAAFDDAVKAGADRERLKNEGQAYANDIIPRAQGAAARLKQEAAGYAAKVAAQADGDAQRFDAVLTEYRKAPGVIRDRMYLDAMQEVYGNVSKVLVDSRNGSQLLYLPLDKLMQEAGRAPAAPPAAAAPEASASAAADAGVPDPSSGDPRSREARGRDRETR